MYRSTSTNTRTSTEETSQTNMIRFLERLAHYKRVKHVEALVEKYHELNTILQQIPKDTIVYYDKFYELVNEYTFVMMPSQMTFLLSFVDKSMEYNVNIFYLLRNKHRWDLLDQYVTIYPSKNSRNDFRDGTVKISWSKKGSMDVPEIWTNIREEVLYEDLVATQLVIDDLKILIENGILA
jgi:hypothetical protein